MSSVQLELIQRPIIRSPRPELPLDLSLFPIFAPVKDRTTMDANYSGKAFIHKFDWGTMQRFGPGLNTYDEDTLIALFYLARTSSYTGNPAAFPIAIASKETTQVYAGDVSAWDINRFLGRPDSGNALSETVQSIQRLGLTVLRLTTKEGRETPIKLFDYTASGIKDASKSRFLIQFPPVMVGLLTRIVVINMDLRKSLPDTGKAIYRHIVGYRSILNDGIFSSSLEEFASRIAFNGRVSDLKQILLGNAKTKGTLPALVDANEIKAFEITGRGKAARLVIQYHKED